MISKPRLEKIALKIYILISTLPRGSATLARLAKEMRLSERAVIEYMRPLRDDKRVITVLGNPSHYEPFSE